MDKNPSLLRVRPHVGQNRGKLLSLPRSGPEPHGSFVRSRALRAEQCRAEVGLAAAHLRAGTPSLATEVLLHFAKNVQAD